MIYDLTLYSTHIHTIIFADVGKHGFILIIRHFVDDENMHDHIIHDCVWSADDCCCKLITREIQPNSVHRRVISWDQLFSLMHALKLENVICAFSNNEFYINVSSKSTKISIVMIRNSLFSIISDS